MSEAEQLEKLCQPVVDWLKKNHDPHTEVRISAEHIDLVESVIGIPVGREREAWEKVIYVRIRLLSA